MKTQSIALVMCGLVLGCGAGAGGVAVASAWKGPTAGKWQCYDATEFPYMNEAAADELAGKVTQGMNHAAPNAPAGATETVSGTSYAIICAKN